jgi:NADH:ubiquinone oxidoreductase subunit 4 (subunit M)
MEATKRKFGTRAFVALMIAFSGLGLPVTGVANHVYGFAPLTSTRHAWMAAHNVLGLTFALFSAWHIVLNRRALWNHAKGTAARLPHVSREAVCAALCVALLLTLFVGHAFHGGR